MKRMFSLLLAMVLLWGPRPGQAKARGNEPLHNVNLDQSASGTFDHDNYFKARWITISATVPGPAKVQVIVSLAENDKVVYSNIWDDVNGAFVTPEIFLDFVRSDTVPYRVEFYVNENRVHNVIIHRMLLVLNGNSFTTRGIRFREYEADLTDQWFMFTPIEMGNIPANGGAMEIDLVGSNMYIVGKLRLTRNGDWFMFTIEDIDAYNAYHSDAERSYDRQWSPEAPVIESHNIRFSGVRIAMYPSFSSIDTVEYNKMPHQYELNSWYSIENNLSGNTLQIIYLNGRISYDPNGLERIFDNINSGNTQKLVGLMREFPE